MQICISDKQMNLLYYNLKYIFLYTCIAYLYIKLSSGEKMKKGLIKKILF